MNREVDLGSIVGPQGPKGDMPFGLELDSDGNLNLIYQDGSTPPNFEYDQTNGNLYFIY
ncbi:hypothetical protein [Frisingicoccus sp.]|uniref:hypothetical protein n=1 Tax=Frisingicoccus sp. TaxID=1918627 RepID=UPI003AB74F18